MGKTWIIAFSPSTSKNDKHSKLSIKEKVSLIEDQIFNGIIILSKGSFDKENDTIVFIAPEWYFRPEKGCYSYDEMDEIMSSLQIVSEFHPNIIIMPGSIYYGIPNKYKTATTVYNCAPVIVGGKIISIIHKFFQADNLIENENWWANSPDEEPKNVEEKDLFFTNVEKEYDVLIQTLINKFNLNPSNVSFDGFFEFKDILFAYEICRDHNAGRLKRILYKKKKDRVDYHIVIANDIEPKPDNFVTKMGGYFIKIDGTRSNKNAIIKCTGLIEPTKKKPYIKFQINTLLENPKLVKIENYKPKELTNEEYISNKNKALIIFDVVKNEEDIPEWFFN